MGAETVVTLIVVAVIVAAIAFFLIAYAVRLQKLAFTLGTIHVGVRAIAHRVSPLESVVDEIAGNVVQIDDALGALLQTAGVEARAQLGTRPEDEEAPVPQPRRRARAKAGAGV